MAFKIIYITYPDKQTAERISKKLVDLKLVACANIFPIHSMYWWDSKVENDDEWVSLVKTRTSNIKAVEKEVIAIHPYEVPCIMSMDVHANKDYEDWIHQQTKNYLQPKP